MTNRAARARDRAGLSIGQAAMLLEVDHVTLEDIEEHDHAFEVVSPALREKMADIYGVNPEWLAGTCPLRNYAAIDQMKDADKISCHDRDILAEFAASLPSPATRVWKR